MNEIHYVETKQANNIPIYIPLNYSNAQEIMVFGSNDSSWFAMSELEVYGW